MARRMLDSMVRGMDSVEEQCFGSRRSGNKRPLRIGPYVLLERLGRGGMGRVYKAEHRLMKRLVALKLAGRLPRGEEDPALFDRFRREIEAAGRVRHPCIVTAYDAGISRGQPYLAMEYIEGIDLERLVQDTGPLSVELACEIVRQTAEALHHAHECGLVHRDIKPSNLMLAPPGVTVKLLDLGLAQLTSLTSSSDADNASEPELCGTPDFMAPEWGHAARGVGVRGDLYSLGCTFYFLLSGQVPYPGGSWTEKLLRHSFDSPAPLQELRPDVPPVVAAIVERLMARAAENRYASADAVAAELASLTIEPSALPKEENVHLPRTVASPTRPTRRGVRFCCTALLAILLGVAAAGAARRMVAPPSPLPASTPKLSDLPFALEGRPEGYSSLASAIAAAKEGDIITIHGPGPFVTPPLSWQGKALTLRAARGLRSRLLMKAADDPWQALLQTDRALTLEGLDLGIAEGPSRRLPASVAPLIRCSQAPLCLSNCRLTTPENGVAIVARSATDLVVRGCEIEAGMVGLSIEVGQGRVARVHLEDSRMSVREASGAALSLWAEESHQTTPVELQFRGNTIQTGCVASLRGLTSPLTIMAHGNRFSYRTALLSYSGYAERDAWRGISWKSTGNSYQGPSSWLWVEGKPAASTELPSIH